MYFFHKTWNYLVYDSFLAKLRENSKVFAIFMILLITSKTNLKFVLPFLSNNKIKLAENLR